MRMGTPVLITHRLRRESVRVPDSSGVLRRSRVWTRIPVEASPTFFVVGERSYADGTITIGDDAISFRPTRRYKVYLVCSDLRRAPVAVLPEDLRPLWVSGG